MDVVIPANHKMKIKENEQSVKHLNLARELKKKATNIVKASYTEDVVKALNTE